VADPATLPLTGERTVPGVAEENYWFRRHEAAYLHVAGLIASSDAGAAVLEVGCGEGYGTALLAGQTGRIVGIDYDSATIDHAAQRYPQATFVRANLAALPFPDETFDAVVTLQVIEHVWNHPEFVRGCLRVLRPGGLLIVSTPNRLTFSPGLDEPANLFHTKEFTAAELIAMLVSCGATIDQVLGLHAGPRLVGLDSVHGGSFVTAQLEQAPDRWPTLLRQHVVSVGTADFGITADADAEIDESLDLLVIARRPG
jgi:SAM-dependent methyltransferase